MRFALPKYWIGKLLLFGFILVIFNTIILPAYPVSAALGNIDRIEGKDRYETAVAISQTGWGSSEYAVLARGDDFADGLCAVPLAAKYNAPILLVRPGYLNKFILEEIQRLGVKSILITGGTEAVAQRVEDTLRRAGINDIRRFAGVDRYETSALIAKELVNSNAVLATGANFPDALSISVPAAQKGMPILLTRQNYLPQIVKEYFEQAEVAKTYLIGGKNVISSDVENIVPSPQRLSGNDRYQTNVAVLKNFEKDLSFDHLYVADGGGPKGNEFADALAGAVLAAKNNSPLILADNYLPQGTGAYLFPKVTPAIRVTGLGGKEAVPDSVLQSIPDLLITKDGSLGISPAKTIAGKSEELTLIYTLEEAFTAGTVEFALPGSVVAEEGKYRVQLGNTVYSQVQLMESGRKVVVSGITAPKGTKVTLSLIDKKMQSVGNYKFKVIADADGAVEMRFPSQGTGAAAKVLTVNSPQLGTILEQYIGQNRSYRALEPKGFVIHSTAMPGGTAQKIYRYFNDAYRAASAHYVVDWLETIQMIPENEVAWHAGKTANSLYLSVEMCEPLGYNPQQFQKVWDRTVILVAETCVRYGWDTGDIFSHNQISNTYHETDHSDPIGYLAKYNRTWNQLLQAIDAKIKEIR
ncbi:MAG TPA: N-acetylmuramoyl-L-alanine amidase [Peptococcaceae bacterium]|nr:N-acetylmuramoyl-L-alanine amidase [Peptococcaceae bacterium]